MGGGVSYRANGRVVKAIDCKFIGKPALVRIQLCSSDRPEDLAVALSTATAAEVCVVDACEVLRCVCV